MQLAPGFRSRRLARARDRLLLRRRRPPPGVDAGRATDRAVRAVDIALRRARRRRRRRGPELAAAHETPRAPDYAHQVVGGRAARRQRPSRRAAFARRVAEAGARYPRMPRAPTRTG